MDDADGVDVGCALNCAVDDVLLPALSTYALHCCWSGVVCAATINHDVDLMS